MKARAARCWGSSHRSDMLTQHERPGSSVGTSVRLKIGRSAVRPRPWPPTSSVEHGPRRHLSAPSSSTHVTATTGEIGLAGHWMKHLLHVMFIYKAKGKPGWAMIPE